MIPALIVIICTDGYNCEYVERQAYPMPNWQVCLEAAKNISISDQPYIVNGERYKQEFHVAAFCGSIEDDGNE